jgi:translation initiation factor 5B
MLDNNSQSSHFLVQIVKKSQAGGGVAVKVEHAVYQSSKMFGRHFDEKDELLSHVTRQSIDVLKVDTSYGITSLSTEYLSEFFQG